MPGIFIYITIVGPTFDFCSLQFFFSKPLSPDSPSLRRILVRKFSNNRRNFVLEESIMAHTRKKIAKIASGNEWRSLKHPETVDALQTAAFTRFPTSATQCYTHSTKTLIHGLLFQSCDSQHVEIVFGC